MAATRLLLTAAPAHHVPWVVGAHERWTLPPLATLLWKWGLGGEGPGNPADVN